MIHSSTNGLTGQLTIGETAGQTRNQSVGCVGVVGVETGCWLEAKIDGIFDILWVAFLLLPDVVPSHLFHTFISSVGGGEKSFQNARQLVMVGQKLVPTKSLPNRNPFRNNKRVNKVVKDGVFCRERARAKERGNKRAPSPITTNRDQPAAIIQLRTVQLDSTDRNYGPENQTTMVLDDLLRSLDLAPANKQPTNNISLPIYTLGHDSI